MPRTHWCTHARRSTTSRTSRVFALRLRLDQAPLPVSTIVHSIGDVRSDASPRFHISQWHAPPYLTAHKQDRIFAEKVIRHSLRAYAHPNNTLYDDNRDGSTYASWSGMKVFPVRVCGDKGAHHIEGRRVDGTANPYLFLAGVLVAGLQAVLSNAELKVGDCRKSVAKMNNAEERPRT